MCTINYRRTVEKNFFSVYILSEINSFPSHLHFLSFSCFIPSSYAAFSVAVIPVLLIMLAVCVVFVQSYQVTAQWKYYDDIYRGRHNIKGRALYFFMRMGALLFKRILLFTSQDKVVSHHITAHQLS